uniref:Uncharacterized protein n=1 Tax=Lygus hesperus TaxID=30085 RepID=A0A0K8SQ65_LYGHE
MLYACRCLNFILDTSGDGEPVASSIVEVLSRRAQGLKLILVNFEAITIKIDVLVGLTRLTSWREFHCSYCDVWVYAHPSSEIPSPASKVIVNKSILVTHRDIKISKEDERFSPVFKIIRLHDNGDDMFSGSRSVPSWDDSLHPVASSWLEEQTQAVKARIRKFSDQQYAELERDRLRAQSEQLSIFRMVGINKSGGETVEEAPRPHSSIGQPTSTEPSSSTSGGYNEPEPVNMPPLDVLESDDLILLEASYSSHHGSLESEESDEEVIEAPEQPDPDQLGPNS